MAGDDFKLQLEPDANRISLSDRDSSTDEQGNIIDDVGGGIDQMLHAAAYTAVQRPIDGLTQAYSHATDSQITAPTFFAKPSEETGWTAAGNFAGTVADYYALSKVVGRGFQATGYRNANIALTGLEAGATGALFEVASPVADDDYGSHKLSAMGTGFLTFGTMGTASSVMDKYGVFGKAGERSLVGNLAVGTTSGGIAGGVHYASDSLLSGKPMNYYDMGKEVAYWGAFGGALQGADHVGTNGVTRVADWMKMREAEGLPIMRLGNFELHRTAPVRDLRNTVDDLRAENVRLQERAMVDDMTKLATKSAGQEALEREVARAARENEPLSAIVIDLDGFKGVNDTFGHNMGDETLRKVGQIMREMFHRKTDIPIRNGGDEFLVLMPNTPLAEGTTLAKELQGKLRIAVGENYVRALDLGELPAAGERMVGASMGTVEWKRPESTVDLIARGDELTYADKAARKAQGLRQDRAE